MMTNHVDEQLFPFILGTLDPSACEDVASHLARCAPCQQRLTETSDELGTLALTVTPVQPPPSLRERLIQSLRNVNRFERFIDTVAQLLDVAREKAASLLKAIDNPSRWVPGPAPGVQLFHIQGGPAVAGAIAGFVRMEPSAVFPKHEHLGNETAFVLQGSFRDDEGILGRTGQQVIMMQNTQHEVTALPGADLIFLVIIQRGIRIGDDIIRADDPRY